MGVWIYWLLGLLACNPSLPNRCRPSGLAYRGTRRVGPK